MRLLEITPEIEAAIKRYEIADEVSQVSGNLAAHRLAGLIVKASQEWRPAFERLTSYPRYLLAMAWHTHLLAVERERTTGRPAPAPGISSGYAASMRALREVGFIDSTNALTGIGRKAAEAAYQAEKSLTERRRPGVR